MKGTLKSRKLIQALFQRGRKLRGKGCLVLYLSPTEKVAEPAEVAFIAGKKLGKAWLRNRAKRRLREAWRQVTAKTPLEPGLKVAVVANQWTLQVPFSELVRELATTLQQAGLLEGEECTR